jgi:MoxR-like ATPase
VAYTAQDEPVRTSQDPSTAQRFHELRENIEQVIQGKREAIHLALVCLLAQGHLLIEDVPGVGKTSLAKSIARSIGGSWHRIQFTPDLLPSDVTGVSVWNRVRGEFEFRPGGVFANIVLSDEINRASPKTQSALLEAMEEQQVTVDGVTYALASPFMVIATQNPIELEGTYPLPEAQLDRFLMRIEMGYPDHSAEVAILESQSVHPAIEDLPTVVTADELNAMTQAVDRIHLASHLRGYIVDLAAATRSHPDLALGVSPRGALALQRSARAYAASLGRDYVLPDDVKKLAVVVLGHRVLLTAEAELRGLTTADVLTSILAGVSVPGATGDV